MSFRNPDGRVRALLVMPRGRRQAWEERLKLLDVAVEAVSRNSRAQEILVAGEPPDLILTDEILIDADWRQMVEEALYRDPNSLIVVCARSAPDSNLWSEVLHRGAYDVIADPNNQTALASLVRSAILRRGMFGTVGNEPSGSATIDRDFGVEAALGT
jgi:DNA-binding NtrC family response regulator